jgi:hypothetical protein
MTSTKGVPPWIAAFFALDLGVVALHVIERATRPWPRGVSQLLDLNREANLPTWSSSLQWFCVAALLGALGSRLVRRSETGGRPLLALAFLFLCLSLDEVAQIHERLGLRSDRLLPSGTRAGGPFPYTGIWMFTIGIPVLILFAIAIRGAAVRLRQVPGAFTKIVVGLALSAFGAMLFDLIGNIGYHHRGLGLPAIEETLEMLGATVVLWGSLDLLHGHGLRLVAAESAEVERAAERAA